MSNINIAAVTTVETALLNNLELKTLSIYKAIVYATWAI